MSKPSFLFYDLETSGVNPREARVMQFAAQRTDMNLQPIGEPYNYLIRLTPEVLPEPEAILVTGITPQQAIQSGLTEAEFLKLFQKDIATSGTVFVGFNSIRFDDEFLRYMHYRNFYDPYAWSWQEGRSRWDMLDVVRMTRALRPNGITWPFNSDGSPTNRLELLTELNGIDHADAHDALGDVRATIAVAQLIKKLQPKLFNYLFTLRDKRAVKELVQAQEPFVYTSGRYDANYEKTTVAIQLAEVADQQGALVYDLRHDPQVYADMTAEELLQLWGQRSDERTTPLPVKLLRYNRCPAVAPMSVLDEPSQDRLQLDLKQLQKHRQTLKTLQPKLQPLFTQAYQQFKEQLQQTSLVPDLANVDELLYDALPDNQDRQVIPKIVAAAPEQLKPEAFTLQDKRLQVLLPLYKARNYPESLSNDEVKQWEAFCRQRLLDGGADSRLHRFARRLEQAAKRPDVVADQQKQYLLQELQLYAESIIPLDSTEDHV